MATTTQCTALSCATLTGGGVTTFSYCNYSLVGSGVHFVNGAKTAEECAVGCASGTSTVFANYIEATSSCTCNELPNGTDRPQLIVVPGTTALISSMVLADYGDPFFYTAGTCPKATSSSSTVVTTTSTSTTSSSTSSSSTTSPVSSTTSTDTTTSTGTSTSTSTGSSTTSTGTSTSTVTSTSTITGDPGRTTASTSTGSSVETITSIPESLYTTATVYATSIYTVTSCPATVTNCPVNKVTTAVTPAYTTVRPVSAGESGPMYTTSTAYSTSTIVVTACPASVTNCPARDHSTTTMVVPVHTSIYPVTIPGSKATSRASKVRPSQGVASGSGAMQTPTPSQVQTNGAKKFYMDKALAIASFALLSAYLL